MSTTTPTIGDLDEEEAGTLRLIVSEYIGWEERHREVELAKMPVGFIPSLLEEDS